MLQPHRNKQFEVLAQLETLATTSLDVLDWAHFGTLEAPEGSVRTAQDYQAKRVYIEQKLPEAMFDYELIAIHLGKTSLSICMSHRHDHTPKAGYMQSSVVFAAGEVHAYHTDSARLGPSENITHNEEAGQILTDRFFHTLGSLGVSLAPRQIELPKAS